MVENSVLYKGSRTSSWILIRPNRLSQWGSFRNSVSPSHSRIACHCRGLRMISRTYPSAQGYRGYTIPEPARTSMYGWPLFTKALQLGSDQSVTWATHSNMDTSRC